MDWKQKCFIFFLCIVIIYYLFDTAPLISIFAWYNFRGGNQRVIIALGDSLTAGTNNVTAISRAIPHPYTKRLAKLLDKYNSSYTVLNYGVPGERVPKMYKRLKHIIITTSSLHLIVILGGTNDCLDLIRKSEGKTLQEVAKDTIAVIKKMHELCHKYNVKSVLLTIPTIPKGDWYEEFEKVRVVVNKSLKEYAVSKNMLLLDLARFIDTKAGAEGSWSDGIHPSPARYDEMGEFIYSEIYKYL